ncbi:paraquat-inducible protein B [Rhodanobacter sp. ANJX3]|uniref:Spy/CpxP family protein refolding chaperone n=1 Tax=unclassified Rhodanobacter TaxID=2621553 RepID=UPI0015CA5608|nr:MULTISPECIES: Spy/CpxP family protein refolding chaperone [unclassified Rhodanobacter]MBB5358216.1 paraquat-inducible protein B [Rhodanobacter sp. ANJX3]NYE29513.1 paraquat-inducible protein B [Rhodanobacter sp. K2T2]
MKQTIRRIALPALLSLAIVTTAGFAQQAPASASSSSMSSSSMSKSRAQKHADVVEQRIAELHSQLNITDQQSKQWDAFTQTMRDNATKTDGAFRDRASKLSSMNADDAMKSYAALAQQHAENMQKLSSAFSDLYAVLSPEQKQVADAMYRNEQAKKKAAHSSHKHGKSAAPASASSAG